MIFPLKKLCLAAALALTLAAPSARAQEPEGAEKTQAQDKAATGREAAPTSQVAGIALANAERVVDKDARTQLTAQLRKLAERAQLPLGEPEVLCWAGEDYKRAEAPNLVAAVTKSLGESGYKYSPMGGPVAAPGSTTTPFTAISDEQKKILMGYWVEADQMLLLAWAPLGAPEPEAPKDAPAEAPQDAPQQAPVAE